MANKNIFSSSTPGKTSPVANTVNHAGGKAYELTAKQALAQYAVTGTFNDTYYTKGADQLTTTLQLCAKVDPTFIAKTAIYSRMSGKMKDMPALLCAHLSMRGDEGMALLKLIFPVVINNGKMLRNFVQIIRSGVVGRKSLGSGPKKLVKAWFASRTSEEIFRQSTGNDPSIADVIKLVHMSPESEERRALYGYLAEVEANKTYTVERVNKKVGDKFSVTVKNYDPRSLPAIVKQYEEFKNNKKEGKTVAELPAVPLEMLEGLGLSQTEWDQLARMASWSQIRHKLNTFLRHGVLNNKATVTFLANKLRDAEQIQRAKIFPYQLFTAYKNIEAGIPREIVDALHDAMEVATKNVPVTSMKMRVAVDVSGSMGAPVTGNRGTATTKTTCVDVASLIASILLRKNTDCEVYPFDTDLRMDVKLEPRDTVMTNASKIAMAAGGGTDCSAVLRYLNGKNDKGDVVIYVSDTESWADPLYARATGMQAEWDKYRTRNPKAKLVCINLAVNNTSQVVTDRATLNIGGWSDEMFSVIEDFLNGASGVDHWVAAIEAMQLPTKS